MPIKKESKWRRHVTTLRDTCFTHVSAQTDRLVVIIQTHNYTAEKPLDRSYTELFINLLI